MNMTPLNRRVRTLVGERRFDIVRDWVYLSRQAPANREAVAAGTRLEQVFYQDDIAWLTGRDSAWVEATAQEYRETPEAWLRLSGLRSENKRTDGITLTLDVAEGFALWAVVKHLRPKVVVELGVQYGLSARLWKEALNRYVPDHSLYLCDLVDRRKVIGDDEATFLRGDAHETLAEVFESSQVDLIHNDAHPYSLIKWSLEEGLLHNVPCFTFHDVGWRSPRGGPFKVASYECSESERRAAIPDDPHYGCWERHIMADVFDRAIVVQERAVTEDWRLQIFDSTHGVGVALRKSAGQPASIG